jgi:hypothetical protein
MMFLALNPDQFLRDQSLRPDLSTEKFTAPFAHIAG